MKLATWNVNSLKVRLSQLVDWLKLRDPDVVCLQETKLEDVAFPREVFAELGYHSVFSGQRTYNGVAILSKQPHDGDVVTDIPSFPDPQRRVLAVTVADVRVICLYVPNGQSVASEKYRYKLEWLGALETWLADELRSYPNVVVLGDFNVAPEPGDVYDPIAWEGQVLFSGPERAAFQRLLSLGFIDSVRSHLKADGVYTWWDYRMGAFRRNRGLRIDHILLSTALVPAFEAAGVDTSVRGNERPSDHAPVWVDLAL